MKDLYGKNLTLLTDLYQLTMAYGYWKSGKAEDEAVFNLFYRKLPFEGGFAIACGLDYVIDYINDFRFGPEELAYLASLNGNNGQPLFDNGFLDYLRNLEISCDLQALKEGTPVFPNEPVLRVKGPIIQCQLLETALLNIINFQTLVATKAARVCLAADGDPVLEFGLRRAQGCDGAIAAARAAFIGGCVATSNVLAGKIHGIPVKGTHAHSWVMSFDTEMEAFETYAEVMPNNCVFLVDTYDTEDGVRNAVRVGHQLRDTGHEMIGIRLDSGDLAELSIKARTILDEAGFENCKIIASNDLDEYAVAQLKRDGARIDIWGIGTKMITAYDQPALGGVYKIAAIRKTGQEWKYTIKLSDDAIKISTPGIQQIQRYVLEGQIVADVIFDELKGARNPVEAVQYHTGDIIEIAPEAEHEELLVPVFEGGNCCYESPVPADIREYALTQLKRLPDFLKTNKTDNQFTVALDKNLSELKQQLIHEAAKVANK